MSGVQAGLAKNWRSKLSAFQIARRDVAKQWKQALGKTQMFVFSSQNGKDPHHIRFPVRVQRPELWQHMLAASETRGLGIMVTYPDAINAIPELRDQFIDQDLPAASRLARQILTVPVHPLLSGDDKRKILSLITAVG
jgi:dTDP-4-amino-4,6-dideoxygalactose transaminase